MFARFWFIVWLLLVFMSGRMIWQESVIWQSVVELPQWFIFAIGFALSVFGISLFWQLLAEIVTKRHLDLYARSLELALGLKEKEIRKIRKIVRQRRSELSLLRNFFSIGAMIREKNLKKKAFPWEQLAVWKLIKFEKPRLHFFEKTEVLRLKWKKG